MRILHIIQRYPPSIGGSEAWCQRVCRYTASKGHYVEVLTLAVYNEDEFWRDPPVEDATVSFGKYEYDGKVKVIRCRRTKINRYFFKLFKFIDKRLGIYFYGPHSMEMYRQMVLRIAKADIVHLHTMPYPHNLIGLVLAKILRKKVIITPHFHIGHHDYERSINFYAMKKCDVVFTVTEQEKQYLINKKIKEDKIFVAYNSVDPQEYKPKDLDSFREGIFNKYAIGVDTKIVIFIGRKIEHKGIQTLIEAIKMLKKEISIKLFLVGPDFPWFREYFAGLSAEDKKDIIDFGAVPHQHKVNLLSISNILVLPSKFEAFGIAFLEGWICGLPVVGGDTEIQKKVIGEGGLCFTLGDPMDLSEKIKSILSNQEVAWRMNKAGKNKVFNIYELNMVGKRIIDAYYLARKNRLKILVISNFFPPHIFGGAEVVAFELARKLMAYGHEVRVFCGKLDNHAPRYNLIHEKNSFKIARVNLHTDDLDINTNNLENKLVQRFLRDMLIDFSPDIIHFHNLTGFPIKLIDECSKLQVPMIMTIHDYWPICNKKHMLQDDGSICTSSDNLCLPCKASFSLRERNDRIRIYLGKFSLLLAPSEYMSGILVKKGFIPSKIIIFPGGVDNSRFAKARIHKRNDGCARVGYVGYLGHHKGIDHLLKAISLLAQSCRVTLDIVASGYDQQYLASLQDYITHSGLKEKVRFLHKVPNQRIADVYSNMDIFVLPSIWPENKPVSICEAMASGLPVIASDIGGIGELVEHNYTGLLFSPGDALGLSQHIQFLASHRQERERLGRNGFDKIKQFDIAIQARKLEEAYLSLIKA